MAPIHPMYPAYLKRKRRGGYVGAKDAGSAFGRTRRISAPSAYIVFPHSLSVGKMKVIILPCTAALCVILRARGYFNDVVGIAAPLAADIVWVPP